MFAKATEKAVLGNHLVFCASGTQFITQPAPGARKVRGNQPVLKFSRAADVIARTRARTIHYDKHKYLITSAVGDSESVANNYCTLVLDPGGRMPVLELAIFLFLFLFLGY